MADQYGASSLPADEPGDIVDPLTHYLGSYLQATLNAQLGAAWQKLAPGKELIRRVFTQNPELVLFNESALPALFVWLAQGDHSTQKLADDYFVTSSLVRVIWLQAHDPSPKRERRLQFAGPLTQAAHAALIEGRHPAWVVSGDPDATAATRGSLVMDWAGLITPPAVRSETVPVTMQADGSDPVTYHAVVLSLQCEQRLTRSAVDRSFKRDATKPARLDLTVSQSTDNKVRSLIPTS